MKLIGPQMGCLFFKKNVDFSETHPLHSVAFLRMCVGFGDICCRTVRGVCLDLVEIFFFPLAMKLIGPQTGCQFFKKM